MTGRVLMIDPERSVNRQAVTCWSLMEKVMISAVKPFVNALMDG